MNHILNKLMGNWYNADPPEPGEPPSHRETVILPTISELESEEITMEGICDTFYHSISFEVMHLEIERKYQEFREIENTEEMFKYVYNMKEAHNILNLGELNEFKDELLANKMREEGNVFFKKKMLKEALEKYNKCIFSAPHPDLSCEKIDSNQYTSLAFGYGNRSAVLFQLKEYKTCISDINRALNLGNSENTQFKLEERKVSCLIGIERFKEAHELLKSCQVMLNALKLEEKVKEGYIKSLSKLLRQCALGLNRGNYRSKVKSRYDEVKYADPSKTFSNDELTFAYNNPSPPSLDDEPNPSIPAFSRALTVQYSQDQGRHVVAARDIKPGEVVAVETAYASCIELDTGNSELRFCTFCLARCAAPVPCPECNNVVFCNEECRSKGWNKFHMKECPVYDKLSDIQRGAVKAYRIIAGQPLDELKAMVSQFQMEEQRSPLENMFNEDQICDSDSYRGIYFLECNIKALHPIKLFKQAVIAFVMTQLLIQSNRFFVSNAGNNNEPDEKDIIFIGSLFIRHLLAFTINSYNVIEGFVDADKESFVDDHIVGHATYVAESLFNHSCIPSVFHFHYGNAGVCRASRFIPSGSQVYVCYYDLYYREPDRNNRKDQLSNVYSFICECDACVKNCRLSFADLKLTYTPSKLREKAKRFSRNDHEDTASLKLELATLKKRNEFIVKSFRNKWYDVKDVLKIVLETLEFFDRFVDVPDPMYMNSTMVFDEIFGRESSICFVNEK